MEISSKLVNFTTNIALSSEGVGANKNYKVGAILFRKKRIITAKANSYKTHTALAKLTKYPHLHAETNCILSQGLDNCNDLSLLVLRVRRPGIQLSMAKPCPICTELIHQAGLDKVYYSDWNGEIKCL